MKTNQNETSPKGEIGNAKGEFSHHHSPFPFPHSPFRLAFTLTELLVVITIIAILAGLGIPAVINALNKGKQAAITLEVQELSRAIEDFKNDHGAYPPNGMRNSAYANVAVDDFNRMFRKAFPRHSEPTGLIQGLAGIGNSTTGTTELYVDANNRGMNGAEAIVFWLGGFSDDAKFPISGPGGPSYDRTLGLTGEDLEGRNRSFDFELGRLAPRDDNGAFDLTKGRVIDYDVDLNQDGDVADTGEQRRINMWFYNPKGSEQPFAYFDASRHRAQRQTAPNTYVNNYDPFFGQITNTLADSLFAIKRRNETDPNRAEFVNQGKFQVLHCGLDDAWGNLSVFYLGDPGNTANSNVIIFPEGPFIGDIADTVGNFMTGTLEDEQE